ncbi:hypothetical protein EIN_047660, partial [Entamoeba invadens IP1]
MEVPKIPSGLQSVKYFSQTTEKRMFVKRVGWITNEDLQMCISSKFLALISNVNYELVEAWTWDSVTGIQPSLANNEEFILVINNSKHHFISNNRSHLLCLLLEYKYKTKSGDFVSFSVTKTKQNGKAKNITLQVRPYGLAEMPGKQGKPEKVILLTSVSRMVPTTDTQSIVFVKDSGDFVIYKFVERRKAASTILTRTKQIGLKMAVSAEISVDEIMKSSIVKKAENEDGGTLVEIRAKKQEGKEEILVCFTERYFVERDSHSYTATYTKPLNDIVHILRANDAMQVVITFADNSQRTYFSSQREAFISALFDCCIAAKADPVISDMPRFASLVVDGMTGSECGTLEANLIKNIGLFDATKVEGIDPTELFMVHVFLFNSNTPPSGPQFAEGNKSKYIGAAIEKVLTYGKPGE